MNNTIVAEEVITKEYELAVLTASETVEADLNNLFKELPEGGSVEIQEKRLSKVVSLAYPIKKHSSANLIVYIIKARPSVIATLKQALSFKEGVLRSMIITPPVKQVEPLKEIKNEVRKTGKSRVSRQEKDSLANVDTEVKKHPGLEMSSTEELAKTLEKLAE